MAKKVQYTTNDPSASTDYLAADNTWKPYSGGGASGIPHGVTSGTDTYTTTISGITSLSDQDAFLIRFAIGNTTGATLNINSLGAKTLLRNNNGPLIGGDIIDGAEMFCIYNTTLNAFQVIGTAPNTLISYVTNADSVTITRGQPVYAFGGQGDRLTVKRAYNTTDVTSAQTVGLVISTSIAANQKGLIMVNGLLDGLTTLPTSTFADGDAVYLGATAGTITNVKPVAPNHLVYLGFCTTASPGAAGRMYVRVQNGYELQELHNVSAQSPANNDILKYNTSTSLWEKSNALSTKQDTITGAATTITSVDLTASRALISNASGKVATNATTSTELGYLSGVTSSIQTQLNSKVNTGGGASNFFIVGSATGLGAGLTRYGNVAGSTAESQVRLPLSSACSISDLYVRTTATMNASASLAVTLFKNGSSTALTLTIAGGSVAGTYSNTANSVSFVAGDGWTLGYVNAGSATAAATSGQSVKITI